MTRYYITHTDQHGERHQLAGTWNANSPDAAIAQMLTHACAEDDGNWTAWPLDTEPTEQGNQYVIPGCERDKTRGPKQSDLF